MNSGHVWIVGAGPGDPGLITVSGAAALAEADVVIYDALASPALLRGAPSSAELIYVGKRAGRHALSQDEINGLIVAKAQAGSRVVRLKGGDPFVFGRGGEEALACRRAGIPYTIVPGITSAIAAPAYAGIPVTHRGLASNFFVVTGNEAADANQGVDWAAAARADTIVILMGATTLAANMDALRAAGLPAETSAACIRWGTRTDQQVVSGTVATIADLVRDARLESPLVTVVGAVAGLGDELAWFQPGPLAGKSIVVTRARAQASDLAARFEALGAHVVEAPVLRVRLLPENIPDADGGWDWIVFASQNGVESFFMALRQRGHDARSLGVARIAAIGDGTAAALQMAGIIPDFQPTTATSRALGDELPAVSGARILLPSSSLTDDTLAIMLRRRGGHVEQVTAYETLAEPLDEERVREVLAADAVTFSSASTATNLREALGEVDLPERTKLVSIGARTSEAVRAAFGRLDAEACEPSIDALVDGTVEVLKWE